MTIGQGILKNFGTSNLVLFPNAHTFYVLNWVYSSCSIDSYEMHPELLLVVFLSYFSIVTNIFTLYSLEKGLKKFS